MLFLGVQLLVSKYACQVDANSKQWPFPSAHTVFWLIRHLAGKSCIKENCWACVCKKYWQLYLVLCFLSLSYFGVIFVCLSPAQFHPPIGEGSVHTPCMRLCWLSNPTLKNGQDLHPSKNETNKRSFESLLMRSSADLASNWTSIEESKHWHMVDIIAATFTSPSLAASMASQGIVLFTLYSIIPSSSDP